ncbi:MAG: hypothetical protein ACE5GQ_05780 [Nitrospinales bacterium]
MDMSGWSPSQIGQFLAFLPFTAETWKRSQQLLGETGLEYWSKVSVNPYEAENELHLAIDKLIDHGRPNAAIACLNKIVHDKQPLDQDRAIKALLSAVSTTEHVKSMDVYHIVEIIKALQDDPTTNPDDLFNIEWAYLPLLDGHHGGSPKLLEQRLASDPNFFCEVIRLIYRSKKATGTTTEPTEQQRKTATKAYRFLDDWKTPPGTQPDGSFSEEHFKKWIDAVQKACSESGHLEVALSHIGSVLIHCPADPDGLWINRVVAEVLNVNSENSERLRNSFSMGIHNLRGAHWVDPTGKPEKELAEKYGKQAGEVENAGYQRFANTLRNLAESYEREVKRILGEHEGGS